MSVRGGVVQRLERGRRVAGLVGLVAGAERLGRRQIRIERLRGAGAEPGQHDDSAQPRDQHKPPFRRPHQDASPLRPSPVRRAARISTARRSGNPFRAASIRLRRASNSASESFASRRPATASISMMSPSAAARSARRAPPPARHGRCRSRASPPEKRPSVISATLSPIALPVERRGRRQHLAHARSAARPLVADDQNLALLVAARR